MVGLERVDGGLHGAQLAAQAEGRARAGLADTVNAARDIEDRQKWWQIGLVIMLVPLAVESVLGRRTT